MSASEAIARLRELRAKATAGEWKPVSFYRSTQLQGENFIVAGRVGVLDGSNHQQDAACIVAAMNSLEPLLACADLVAMLHDIWNDAQDDCDKGGFVEDHILKHVAAYTDNDPETAARHLLCDLVEKVGRKARLALQALAEGGGE